VISAVDALVVTVESLDALNEGTYTQFVAPDLTINGDAFTAGIANSSFTEFCTFVFTYGSGGNEFATNASGTGGSASGTYTSTDVFSIYTDGAQAFFYKNGVLLGTPASLNTAVQYRFVAAATTATAPAGYTFTNVRFYPTGRIGYTGATGSTGPTGDTGPGFQTINTPDDYRILSATGASTSQAQAWPGLTFDGTTLTVSNANAAATVGIENINSGAGVLSYYALRSTAPSATATTRIGHFLGRDTDALNGLFNWFYYQGAGSTNNYLTWDFNTIDSMLVLAATGNVGIRKLVPAYTLDVGGTAQVSNLISPGYIRDALTPNVLDISGGNIRNTGRIVNGAGTVSAPSYTFGNDVSMGLYDPATNVLGFVSGGLERMRIDASGNVGIGTSNAATRLHVLALSNDASHGILCVENNQAEDSNVGAGLSFKARYHNTLSVSSVIFGKIDALKEDPANYSDTFMAFSTRFDTNRPTGGNGELRERMRLTSGGRLGIGTTAPTYNLDISGQGAAIAVGSVAATGSGLLIQGFSNQGYIRPQAASSTLFLGASNINSVQVNTVGLGAGVFPAYAIDACGGGTTASVNMSTWPRFSISNVAFTRGVTALRGGVVQWNTFSNSINNGLLTVTHSTASGSFFQILRAGIWAIDWQLANNAFGPIESYLDVCTSLASTTYAALASVGSMVKFARNEAFLMGASYVGYLQSNSTTYYRIWTNAAAISNNNYSQLRISFLGETNSNATYPILT
jgi:hypothetical protein